MKSPEFYRAFDEHNRRDLISNSKLASVLSIILMPLGGLMDQYAYPDKAGFLLELRLCSSLLVFVAWMLFLLAGGQRFYRVFGVLWYMIPTVFITWMIYVLNDPESPYYAGLNLVLLAIGTLSPWTAKGNLVSSFLIIAGYCTACYLMPQPQTLGSIFNNLFFLIATSTVVVGGSFAHRRLRYREFELRWELDRNRRVLEDANQKLKELDQVKNRFFANVSHELRTPLTLLLAPLETMLHRSTGKFEEHTRNLLLTMHSNGMRLLRLINDLLDLVRLESGRMETRKEPVEVAELARGLASAVRQVAEDKKIQLETEVDPALGTVLADRDKLEKIVLNLVFNALKFTPAGGRVDLQVRKEDDQMLLTVRDTGMGISAENLPHVFSRFWQADSSSRRKYQGVGIGLALVKELTEIQGGQVSVQSQEGKGTTFLVRLPAQPIAHPGLAASPPAAEPSTPRDENGTVTSEEWLSNLYRRAELFPAMTPVQTAVRPVENLKASNKPKVLVADDEPDMLRFLRSQLVSNYDVIEAVDGQQAIDKAGQFLPDIVLLDMMMPEKDGLQACKELRERTATQSIPIMLLTARADEETKLSALSAGASDFLAKPFSTTELHVRIKNLVDSYDYQRKLARQNQVLEQTIEQLKETETQLVQTEKMASLGRMSAGIIHEINNPLTFATTGLFTLRKKSSQLAPEQRAAFGEILGDVEEGLGRVKTIISDLRAFSHHQNEAPEPVVVGQALQSALRFLSHQWKEKVAIELNVPENLVVWANRNKLIHVFVNLLQNSIYALEHKKFVQGQPAISIQGNLQAGQVRLRFRDNGEGIAPEVIDKIFDPFFTTKEVGEGMGLGLSICYRIVQAYDGVIRVRSERGQYSEFTLEFPDRGTDYERSQAA